MNSVLNLKKYLSLNRGRYFSEMLKIPRLNSGISVTTHLETAATDLPHYHETSHLSFILKGGALDKRKTVETECISGELMFFRAGEVHQTIYRGFPVKSVNIALESEYFQQNSVSETNLKTAISQNPNAKFTMLKIYKELAQNDEFTDNSIEILLLSLLDDGNFKEKNHPLWLNRIVELLNDNWNEEISVIELAAVAGVHPKTVSKFFPRYFNCTLGEYRRRLKIEKALALIKYSNLSLTEIAYECGFYDQSHFTGTFKELTGFRPKEFQKI